MRSISTFRFIVVGLALSLTCITACRKVVTDDPMPGSNDLAKRIRPITLDEASESYVSLYLAAGNRRNQMGKQATPFLHQLDWLHAQSRPIDGADGNLLLVPGGRYKGGVGVMAIAFIKDGNEIRKALMGWVPKDTNHVAGHRGYTGDIYLHTLEGDFVKGWRMDNDVIVGLLVPAKQQTGGAARPTANDEECDPYDTDCRSGGNLPEVAIFPPADDAGGGITLGALFWPSPGFNPGPWNPFPSDGPALGGGGYGPPPPPQPDPRRLHTPKVMQDKCAALDYIMGLSHLGGPDFADVETFMWITDKGVIVVPNTSNTDRYSSGLTGLGSIWVGGELYLTIPGSDETYKALANVHTHPLTTGSPGFASDRDCLNVENFPDIPSFILDDEAGGGIFQVNPTGLNGGCTSDKKADYNNKCSAL